MHNELHIHTHNHMRKKLRLGTQDVPPPGVRNLLRASSIANPKAPVYIQKEVRLGIQDFPLQRVIAATLPPSESFVYRKP